MNENKLELFKQIPFLPNTLKKLKIDTKLLNFQQ